MSGVDQIETKCHLKITPNIDLAGDANDVEDTSSTKEEMPSNFDTDSIASGGSDGRLLSTTLKISFDWALVVAHSLFKMEYQDFIRN